MLTVAGEGNLEIALRMLAKMKSNAMDHYTITVWLMAIIEEKK